MKINLTCFERRLKYFKNGIYNVWAVIEEDLEHGAVQWEERLECN